MADDVYKIKADVSQYSTAIEKLVAAHEKLLKAESLHATKLSAIEAAEKGATHSIQGVTKAGLAFTSSFKAVNGILEQTAAKLEVLKHKGGQSVSESIKRTILSTAGEVTTPQVVKIDKAVANLDELLDKNKYTKKQLENVWQGIRLNISSKLEGELGKVQAVLKTLDSLTKQKAVKTLTPDFSKSGAAVSSLSKDKDFVARAQALRAKAVTASEATASKLLAIETKNSADILSVKKKAAASLLDVEKAKGAQLKKIDGLSGVRAQNKAKKDLEIKASADIVKIATQRRDKLDSLLVGLNAARKTHNQSQLKVEQTFTSGLNTLLKRQETDYKASLARRLAAFRTAKEQEKTLEAKASKTRVAEKHRAFSGAQVEKLTTDLPTGKKATVGQQIDLRKASAALKHFYAQNRAGLKAERISVKQLGAAWKAVAANNVAGITDQREAMATLLDKIKAVRLAQSRASAASGVSSSKSIREAHRLSGELDKQREKLLGVTLSWQTMFRLIVSQATSRILSSFLAQLSEARDTALELSKNFARIQTLDSTSTPVDAWIEGVRTLSEESGLGIIDQTTSAYEALSNQIGEGTASLGFLTAANDLAIISGATAAESGTLLADAIHAWGLEIEDSGEIAAKFFKIVDLGRATVAEMAPNLGRISVPAAQLGISLEEVGAALATTTIKGVKMETASTLLRNVFLKLAKPSKELKEYMAELGFETGEAWIQTKKLPGVLADLEKEARGSSSRLAELFPNIRSMTGAMIFAGDGIDVYNNSLKGIQTATLEYDANVNLVKNSLGKLYEVAAQKIENVFVFDTAQPLLQFVADLTNNFDDLVTVVKAARVALGTLAGAALPTIAAGAFVLLKSTAGLAVTLLRHLHPVLRIAALIGTAWGAAEGFLATTSTNMEGVNRKYFVALTEKYDELRKQSRAVYATIRKDSDAAFTEALKPMRAYFEEQAKANNKIQLINKQSLKEFRAYVSEVEHSQLGAAKSALQATKDRVEELKRDFESLQKVSEKLAANTGKANLATSLVGETDLRKILTLNKEIERLGELREKATTAAGFNKITAQIEAATAKKQAIELKISADPASLEKAYDDAFDQLEARQRTFADRGDQLGVQRTKKEYNELLDLYNADVNLGLDSDYFNSLVLDIKDVKAELKDAAKDSDTFFNLQDELANLEQLKAGLGSVFQTERAGGLNVDYLAAQEETSRLKEKLSAQIEADLVKEQAAAQAQVQSVHELTVAFNALKSSKLEDFNTTVKATEEYRRQLGFIQKIQSILGQDVLSGTQLDLKRRSESLSQVSKDVETRADFEADVRKSGEESKRATRVEAAAETAVRSAANLITDLAAKLNVVPEREIKATTGEDYLFGGLQGFVDQMARLSDLMINTLAGAVENPIAAWANIAPATISATVDPAVLSKLDASVSEIAALSKAAAAAALPTAGPEQLNVLKEMLSELKLSSPLAKALKGTEANTAQEKADFATNVKTLSAIEQLVIKLSQEDTVSKLGTAKETQVKAQADLERVSTERASLLTLNPELAKTYKEQTTAAINNSTAINNLTAIIKSTQALPKTISAGEVPLSAPVTNIGDINISVKAKDQSMKQQAKEMGDAMFREMRLRGMATN